MISMKEKIEAKRVVLCSLADVPESSADEILTGDFEGKELKYVITLLDELKKDGYVNDYISKDKMKTIYSLTRKGDDRAEYLSSEERWEETLKICSKLNDFSERTVDRVYDQILQKDISILIGNPINNIAEAIYQLNSGYPIISR